MIDDDICSCDVCVSNSYTKSIYKEHSDEHPWFYSINEISPNLFIGDEDASFCRQKLKEFNIDHVLIVSKNINPSYPKKYKYSIIKIDDKENENIEKYFFSAHEIINKCVSNNLNILVHCSCGISRSASIVISYLMIENKIRFKESYDIVKKSRKCIEPNSGFISQLIKLENKLFH